MKLVLVDTSRSRALRIQPSPFGESPEARMSAWSRSSLSQSSALAVKATLKRAGDRGFTSAGRVGAEACWCFTDVSLRHRFVLIPALEIGPTLVRTELRSVGRRRSTSAMWPMRSASTRREFCKSSEGIPGTQERWPAAVKPASGTTGNEDPFQIRERRWPSRTLPDGTNPSRDRHRASSKKTPGQSAYHHHFYV